MTLASVAFGEAAGEMGNFASSMQQVTNFEDDKMLSLMAKLSQTFKLNKDETVSGILVHLALSLMLVLRMNTRLLRQSVWERTEMCRLHFSSPTLR